MEKILFKEEQRFSQWWLWIIIICSFIIPMIFIASDFANNENTVQLIYALFIISAIGFVVMWLFGKMKLYIEITTEKIKFRFPPFINKWRMYDKSEINSYEVRKYKPIKEYGGWGIKGSNPLNKAYNVRGNIGLQLYLKNGKKLLIGTQKKQANEYAMCKIMGVDKMLPTSERNSQQPEGWPGKKAKKILIILAIEIAIAILIFGIIQVLK